MKIQKLIIFYLFIMLFFTNNHVFAKNNTKNHANDDTLFFKSSQELIIMLGKNIEKYAGFDYVFGTTSYKFINLKTETNKLTIVENDGGDDAIYTINLSKIEIGKNIRLKNWGKKTFSVIFDKTITQKGKRASAKKFEVMFESKGKKNVDYDKIKQHITDILYVLNKKQQL